MKPHLDRGVAAIILAAAFFYASLIFAARARFVAGALPAAFVDEYEGAMECEDEDVGEDFGKGEEE